MSFHSVRKNRPCLICEKGDWCSYDDESQTSLCRRTPGGISKKDKSGLEYWLYMPENKKIIQTHSKGASFKMKPIINIDERNTFYSGLLEMLPLSGQHLHQLTETRKLPYDQVVLRQYKTLKAFYASEIAHKLLNKFGESVCLKMPGFILREDHRCTLSVTEGLVIPVRDQYRRIVALKIRTDSPDESRYLWMSSQNGVSSGSHVHFPIDDYSSNPILRITEGELKADITSYHSKVPTLSLPGVSSWRMAIPIIQKNRPKLIKVAFDSDFYKKRMVASSLIGFCDYLKRAGFNYEVETWSN